ncbi:MAG: HalOD1 output domain-containing protein [Salinigranum sp.]
MSIETRGGADEDRFEWQTAPRRGGAERGASTGEYVVRHEFESREQLCVTVAGAVAAVAERDPVALRAHLDDVVDPEAMDRLFTPKESGEHRAGRLLAFRFCGHLVVVTGDGVVRVVRSGDDDPVQSDRRSDRLDRSDTDLPDRPGGSADRS